MSNNDQFTCVSVGKPNLTINFTNSGCRRGCIWICTRHRSKFWVESRAGIILRPSLLEPCVRLSSHTAPDVSGFRLAHVYIVVAALMNGVKVVPFPVLMVSIFMVYVYSLFTDEV
jgi:hypothetical protein